MPERATVTRRVRGGASRAQSAGQAAMDRLTQSVEAAQEALKDLSKELNKGTRDVLKDLDTTLRPRSVGIGAPGAQLRARAAGDDGACDRGKPRECGALRLIDL